MLSNMIIFATWLGTDVAAVVDKVGAAVTGLSTIKSRVVAYGYDLR